MLVQVVVAYTTDHYPLEAEYPEIILGLANGLGVLLPPDGSDTVFESLDGALAAAVGTPHLAPWVLMAWNEGYPVSDTDSSQSH